ncbi:MAG TPA: chorismate-binding protein, partial [Candidatus Paceibacterota bacterium]|nr:chorismate-binding protein [Candidatus Paceibacterota bacterium]
MFTESVRKTLSDGRRYVPIIETITACVNPADLYEIMTQGNEAPACILEGAGSGKKSRFSFVCFNGKYPMVVHDLKDLQSLKKLLHRNSPLPHKTLPFIGGYIGGIGHEAISLVEKSVEPHPIDPFNIPLACLYFFHEVIVVDNEKNEMHVVVNVLVESTDDNLILAYENGCSRVGEIIRKISLGNPNANVPDKIVYGPIVSNMTIEEYCHMVEEAKSLIEQGEVFQIVLSQRFSAPYYGSSLALYRELRALNPSPYMFYMRYGSECRNMVLLGASPEVMVGIDKGKMRIRPIAGTRRRVSDLVENERLKKELLDDPKERAEHMMLVDLARNDVGKYCGANSIRVTTLMEVENYSHVMHIVSEVQAMLRDGVHPLDACLGSLPAGTLSGAPKVRALQHISRLEKSQRGLYGGTFGWFTHESLDTCIFIRSAMLLDGVLHWQSGAGIVADSVPQSEYDETIVKA